MSKEQKRQAFYTQSPEEVLQAVDATEQGLSSSEAEKRLAEFGHNELEEGEKRSILVKFIEQFKIGPESILFSIKFGMTTLSQVSASYSLE